MRRRMLGIAAGAAIAVVVFAWPIAAKDVQVAVQDNEFVPKTVEITVGDTVVWSHQGSRPHTVTADDGSWDSNPDCPSSIAACMVAGQSYERKFDQAGTFPYYCKLHGSPGGGGMAGVVVVKAATATTSAPPPPTTAPPATNPPQTTQPTSAPTTTEAVAEEESTATTSASESDPGEAPLDGEPEATSDEATSTTSTSIDLAADVEISEDGGDDGAPVGLIAGGAVLLLAAAFAGWRYWPRPSA